MAVTILREPYALVPGYNDIEFLASSSVPVSGNFNYYVTVGIGSDTFVYRIPPDENDQGYFNLRPIAEKYLRNFYPFGQLGWTAVDEGYKSFVVNIGEEYGTPPTVHTGTNKTIRVWNAALKLSERSNFRYPDYSLRTEVNWLNNIGELVTGVFNATVKRDQDLTFYLINDVLSGNKISTAQVACIYIDPDGNLSSINGFDILNGLSDEYICINLSPSAVNALEAGSPGTCVGSFYPTPFGNGENAMVIDFIDNSGSNIHKRTFIKIEDVCAASRYEEKWLYYQNRSGAFDFINLYGNHRKKIDVTKDYYRAVTPRFQGSHLLSSSDQNGPNPLDLSKKVLSSNYEENQTFLSSWLSQDEVDAIQDLFTSSFIFIQHGYNDYQRLHVSDLSYEVQNKSIQRMVQIQVNVSQGNLERRQFE
jgi:hypothetical protein